MAKALDGSALSGVVVFAGRLASMKRADAYALVERHGGTPRQEVSKRSTVMVVGELGWPLLANGHPSNSLGRAKTLGVPLVSERQFLEWAALSTPADQALDYTVEQVAALSGLPVEIVEQLGVYGLLHARNGRCGFRDLAGARQIAELLRAGVGLSVISASLRDIREWMPGAGPANLRLFPASSDALVIAQLNGFTDKRGQFLMPVEKPRADADRLFAEAQDAEEREAYTVAERLYRRAMKADPGDPTAAFNLANMLRGLGRRVEAEALYRQAVGAEPRLAEGWYNLGDLLDEQGRLPEAIASLERAVAIDPDYADAIFNLALLLQRSQRTIEAGFHWRKYLKLDESSPWAARARKALRYCEMVGRERG
jgi:tetratricopeptide (TPR) repeat protein